jgi:hypothetical protein
MFETVSRVISILCNTVAGDADDDGEAEPVLLMLIVFSSDVGASKLISLIPFMTPMYILKCHEIN